MFIELAEILICPACRAATTEGEAATLIAIVDELHDRRMSAGWLGCSACRTRYRVAGGAVRFGPARRAASLTETGLGLAAAAMLALHERSGYVVTGEGLEAVAAELAGFGAAVEPVVLSAVATGRRLPLSRLIGVSDDALPLRAGSVTGVVLVGAGAEQTREAARVLQPAGRLVVLRPDRNGAATAAERELRAAGFQPIATETSAIVAVRPA